MGTPNAAPWADAEIAHVRQSWAEGRSAREIAETLIGRTRNAVIGIIHRRLEPRREKAPSKPRPPRQSRAVFRKPKFSKARPMRAPEPVASLSIPLVDLRADQCHAITDATRFEQKYCGHPVQDGSCYCAGHFARFRIITGKAR